MLTIRCLEVDVANDGTGARYGDYEYIISINGKVLFQGAIKGHDRSTGWPDLLQRIVNAA